MRGVGSSTDEVLALLKTRGTSSSLSSSETKGSVSSSILFILGLGEEEVEVEGGMVCVWAEVVGGVGTVCGGEGLGGSAVVEEGGGLVCVCILMGTV